MGRWGSGSAVGLLFLSATGLTWSRFAGDNITDLRAALSWTTPSVSTKINGRPNAEMAGHEGHHGAPAAGVAGPNDPALVGDIDRVLTAARRRRCRRQRLEVGVPAPPAWRSPSRRLVGPG